MDLSLVSALITNGLLVVSMLIFALGVWLAFERQNKPKDVTFARMLISVSFWVFVLVSFGSIYLVLFGKGTFVGWVPDWVVASALLGGMAIISATILRKNLLENIRFIGAEFFLFFILLIFVTEMATSAGSPEDFNFRLAILIVIVLYGAMMITSFVGEIKRLKEIEDLHKKLTAVNKVLMRADRLKTRFVSFASHQLRAPLGGIRGYLDMLQKGDFGELNKMQKNAVSLNFDAANRLTQTIEMFLDVTKIELGKLDLIRMDTDIRELVDKVVQEMLPVAEKKGLSVTVRTGDDIPVMKVDSSKIYHVLVNLIDNAVKYTESGGVEVRAARVGDDLEIRVADTGMGLDKKGRDELLSLFKRGIAAVKLETSGEGLGLYIVKNIVDAHGGEMIIESEGPGKGSEFGFRIPLS